MSQLATSNQHKYKRVNKKQKTNILMIHMPEQLNLPQRPLGINPIIKRIRNLLYRHMLIRLRIQRRTKTNATKSVKINTTLSLKCI